MKKTAFIAIPLFLFSVSAGAQNAWDLTVPPDDYIVMGTSSGLTLTASNTGTGDPISYIVLWFRGASAIQSVDTPPGWGVVDILPISFLNLIRVRLAVEDCASGSQIDPGESADFTVNLTWTRSSADVVASLWSSSADDSTCGSGTFSQSPKPSFLVRGLETSLSAEPVAVGVGGTVLVTLDVTNRSTADKTVTPSSLTLSVPGVLSCSGTPPSQVIGSGATGSFTWTCTADSSGQVDLSASADGVDVTGGSASASVVVGDLTATMSVLPSGVIDGGEVDVTMTVKNNGSTLVHAIVPPPDVDVGLGSAGRTLVSGPTPTGIASLSPGQCGCFTWTYQVTGLLGDDFAFQGQASAESGNVLTNVATTDYGSIVEYSAEANPATVYTGQTNQVIAFTIYNNGLYPVDYVSISPDVRAGWSIDTNNEAWASLDQSGWTPSGYDGFLGLWMDFQAPGAADQIPPGGSKTFTTILATTPGTETVTNFRVEIYDTNGTGGTAVAIVNVVVEPGSGGRKPPDVDYFTGTTSSGEAYLYWGNPDVHDGVLILRSEAPASQWCAEAVPVDGFAYTAGERLCDSPDPIVEVVYFDTASYVSSYTDQAVTPDARVYYYRIYNHDDQLLYSAGLVPSSSGISIRPTDCVSPNPCWAWQYASGGAALSAPPSVRPGASVYANTNTDLILGIDSNLGTQLFDPYNVTGTIQGRYAVAPVTVGAASRNVIFASTDAGIVYAVDADTGASLWTKDTKRAGQAFDGLLAAPVLQIWEYSDGSFQSAYSAGQSVIFVATAYDSITENEVIALDASDGTELWRFSPLATHGAAMDMASGRPLVDYSRNVLYISTGDGGAGQDTVWAISTLDGSLLWRRAYGDSTFSVSSDSGLTRIYFGNEEGTLYCLQPLDGSIIWTWSPAAAEDKAGFVVSAWKDIATGYEQRIYLATRNHTYNSVQYSGKVWALKDLGTSATVDWSTPIDDPSMPIPMAYSWLNFDSVYVGSSDGRLHELNVDTGIETGTSPDFLSGQVGTPAVDRLNARFIVGTLAGNVFSIDGPFH